jgi:uncharacterized membrane protein YgdD (TMEM256/DUF423 family)
MNKTILGSGIFFGLLAVVLGAFGSHGLKGLIPAEDLEAYRTGVDYQMYHSLLLLVLGSMGQLPAKSKKWVFFILVVGIICFSFSLYLLAINSLTAVDLAFLGIFTPIGGSLLIGGWILLAYRLFKPLT